MTPPMNRNEVRGYIEMIDYNTDILARRSHTLQAWTKLMSMWVKFKCTSVEQELFEEIKQILAKETLLVYLNFNRRFEIHTYARDYQLGTVMS